MNGRREHLLTAPLHAGTGDPKPEEDETLWYVPLELKTIDKSGKAVVDHKAVLEGRETVLPLEDAANATYKLNAETAGVCESETKLSVWCCTPFHDTS